MGWTLARRRHCRVARWAFVVLAGDGSAARRVSAETVSFVGSFGPGQAPLSSGTIASIVASPEDPSATDAESLDVSGDSGSFKWQSGVVAPGGAIYACPLHATVVLKVDPVSDTVSVFGNEGSGNFKWRHAVLASNGNIYCIPDSASSVLKINPNSDTTSHFGNLGGGAYKWKHAVLAATGAIYGIPFHASSVLKIDPLAETATTNLASASVNDFGAETAKWQHGVLASSTGVIYGIPCSANSVLRVDPATDAVTTLADLSSAGRTSCKWLHGVEARNGVIYAVPCSASAVLKIEPESDTVTMIDSFTNRGAFQWRFSVLSTTGVIYGLPDKAESVLRIAPGNGSTADNITLLGSFPGAHYKYRDGAVVADGIIYGIPFQAGSVLKIDPETDSAATFASFGGSQMSKWRGAVVAANGAVYAFPSGASSVLKVNPEGAAAPADGSAPADGREDSAPATASAGVVGASVALVSTGAFCGVALILHKRWHHKTTRRLERVANVHASKLDSASESTVSTTDGFSPFSTSSSFGQGQPARHPATISRAATSTGPPSLQSTAPHPELLPPGSTAPTFPEGAGPNPAPLPCSAIEGMIFSPPSSAGFCKAHSSFSPKALHRADHCFSPKSAHRVHGGFSPKSIGAPHPNVHSYSSRPAQGTRCWTAPPMQEFGHDDSARAMPQLRDGNAAVSPSSSAVASAQPQSPTRVSSTTSTPTRVSSTTVQSPSVATSDLRSMSGFVIGSPAEGMDLIPPPPYVPKDVRRQVERLHQKIVSSGSLGSLACGSLASPAKDYG